MTKPIRLLHLSDIHFRADTAWDADPVLRARGFNVDQIKAGLDPHLVAVTGDLAQPGKAAEMLLTAYSHDAIAELLQDEDERELVLKRRLDYLDFYAAWPRPADTRPRPAAAPHHTLTRARVR